MKTRSIILVPILFLFALPAADGHIAPVHSEIFFPKLFSRAELAYTGFGWLNPQPYDATLTIFLISADGTPVSRRLLLIGPGSQAAKLGSELFPESPEGGGWVYAVVDTEGIQAFWLDYDAGITSLDGAEAAQLDTIGSDQIVPFVGGQTELNVINPNNSNTPLTIQLFGDNGELDAFYRKVPVAGGFQSQVSAMFPSTDMTQARYIRIRTDGAPISSSAIIRDFLVPHDFAVVNGVNVNSRTELNFPHVINGALTGANYTTLIGVTNLSASSQTVALTFTPDAGPPIEVNRTISGGGALRETARSLFGLSTQFQTGWVRVEGVAITGFAAYADTIAGGLAVASAGDSQTEFFFCHIANGPPQWQTGLALLNPGSIPAAVEVYAINSSGSLIGGAENVSTARFTLEPGTKIATVIDQLIPQALGVNGGFVYVKSSNSVPLYGIELFYTKDLKVLSNVSPGKVMLGFPDSYTPPAP